MLKKTASKSRVAVRPASDAGSDATLSHSPVASGLVPDEEVLGQETLRRLADCPTGPPRRHKKRSAN
jgi:hypothetical protein